MFRRQMRMESPDDFLSILELLVDLSQFVYSYCRPGLPRTIPALRIPLSSPSSFTNI